MALNFSHLPVFPALMSEDNLVTPMRIVNGCLVEGTRDKADGNFRREVNDCFDYGSNRVDRGGSQESVSKDIVDLLPSDPFGMDISTTITAITGWLEDLEVDYGSYGRNNVGVINEEYGLFAGFNLIWNSAMRFQPIPRDMIFEGKFSTVGWSDSCTDSSGVGLHHSVFGPVHQTEVNTNSNSGSSSVSVQKIEEGLEVSGCCYNVEEGVPHEALPFALSYLELRDLLSVGRVCKSLHSIVRNDPFLWRSIHVDQPLSERITDDTLLQLTSRAQGNLQCLSMVECSRITDDGLKHVLDTNPKLAKLCVSGCTRLSIDGIVNNLKSFNNNKGTAGIKNLRIGGLYGVTSEHFEELNALLGADCQMQKKGNKPHFYHRGSLYLLCDDDRAIDIEICPRCQKLRLVYDCVAEDCQAKDHTSQVCRACILCIPRCVQCGRCINDSEYEETFCLELLCSDCFKQLLNCQEEE